MAVDTYATGKSTLRFIAPSFQRRAVFAALIVGTSLATSALPAMAKIACTRDGFQIVQGNLLATPYCQDQLLARVAREYGLRVSDAEVRNNPNSKRRICRFVGRDIRVQPTCAETNYGRRGF